MLLPMSYQTEPESAADCTITVGVRQAFCVMAGSQTGSWLTSPSNAPRSAGVGPRNSGSPPPLTITALLSVVPFAMPAATRTGTVMAFGLVDAAPMTLLLRHSKRSSFAAPLQVQPVPVGAAVSRRPVGRRSRTRISPTVGRWPWLRTRMV